MPIAWGARMPIALRNAIIASCERLLMDPSNMATVECFESAHTFSPSIRNAAGSGAIGLIQFMPSTAAALGTSIEALARMNVVDQQAYVERYFWPWKGRLNNLGDVYGAVLWPGMIGKPDSYIVFRRNDGHHPARYIQNRGLDWNRDGVITRGEITARIAALKAEGLQPGNIG